MEYIFSKHALDQMIRREISKEQVYSILKQSDFTGIQDAGTKVYSKLLTESSNSYLYRVFVNELKKPSVIITVYKTSKKDKYVDKIRQRS